MSGQRDEEVLPSAPRVLGGWEGLVEWNGAPLPAEVLAAFAGDTVPATA